MDPTRFQSTEWLVCFPLANPHAPSTQVLLCFTPSGAGATVFSQLAKALTAKEHQIANQNLLVCGVQLPGREQRCKEALEVDTRVAARGLIDDLLKRQILVP